MKDKIMKAIDIASEVAIEIGIGSVVFMVAAIADIALLKVIIKLVGGLV